MLVLSIEGIRHDDPMWYVLKQLLELSERCVAVVAVILMVRVSKDLEMYV